MEALRAARTHRRFLSSIVAGDTTPPSQSRIHT
jgi:hypothetical protein